MTKFEKCKSCGREMAIPPEHKKPAGCWEVAAVKQIDDTTWVRLVETQYVADEQWPQVGQTLEEVR